MKLVRRTRGVNNPHNRSFREAMGTGYLYCAASLDRPYWLKLGATSRHPLERLAQFKEQYNLADIQPVFFFELAQPVSAEYELSKRLRSYNCRQNNTDSREWYDIPPARALEEAERVIEVLKLRRWGGQYINRRFISYFGQDGSLWLLRKMWPAGGIVPGSGLRSLNVS